MTQIYSLLQNELSPQKIEVELHSRFQIPSFHILGLPGPEIQEARERIIAAFSASKHEFPKKKVMINLTPSSQRKTGTGHDLAIALKIIFSTRETSPPFSIYAWGELGLDGTVKPAGAIAKWIELLLLQNKPSHLYLCKRDHHHLIELLHWRKKEGLPLPQQLKIYEINHLKDIDSCHVKDPNDNPLEEDSTRADPSLHAYDSSDAHPPLLPLNPFLERSIKIAVTGRHHLLILGPKGMGKSQSLEWIARLLPHANSLQTWERFLHSHSAQQILPDFKTPIRRVHSNIKPAHLLGSWSTKGFMAGELTRAHGGVLIADEFLEWPRDAKECLREPLEQKHYSLTRKQGTIKLSCDIQFVGTGNLCPCGGLPAQFHADCIHSTWRKKGCHCKPSAVHQYMAKLSGPVADRIDLVLIHTEPPTLEADQIKRNSTPEDLKNDVKKGQAFCMQHFGMLPSQLSANWLEENLPVQIRSHHLWTGVSSLRSRHKILRVARTVQALEKCPELKIEHVLEASTYRFEGLLN